MNKSWIIWIVGIVLFVVTAVYVFTGQGEELPEQHIADASEYELPQAVETDLPDTSEAEADEVDSTDVVTEGTYVPTFKYEQLTEEIIERIRDISWTEDAPVTLAQLRYLTVSYVGFDGGNHEGELIANMYVAGDLVEIFEELYNAGYPMSKMVLIDDYDGDDNLSMADNNTSAFNFRAVPGSDTISNHSYGIAIDINPLINPYVHGNEILPPEGDVYVDRENVRPGMIIAGDLVYNAFVSRGWTWGGDWETLKDYQHFEKELN